MNNFILLVGASGSGKSSIADKLSEMYGLKVLQSYTTRPKRYKDETGHTFITQKEFNKLKDKLAYFKGYNYEYCATQQQVEDNDIYVIDPKAAKELKSKYSGNKNIKIIYIRTSAEFRYSNMIKRGDKYRDILKRIISDVKIFQGFSKRVDLVINNNSKTKLEDICKKIYRYINK